MFAIELVQKVTAEVKGGHREMAMTGIWSVSGNINILFFQPSESNNESNASDRQTLVGVKKK